MSGLKIRVEGFARSPLCEAVLRDFGESHYGKPQESALTDGVPL